MGYLVSIKVAMLVFPELAFLLTLPYMVVNYRKYGSINKTANPDFILVRFVSANYLPVSGIAITCDS